MRWGSAESAGWQAIGDPLLLGGGVGRARKKEATSWPGFPQDRLDSNFCDMSFQSSCVRLKKTPQNPIAGT